MEQTINKVCEYHQIEPSDLIGNRLAKFVMPKHIIYHLLIKNGYTREQIAKRFKVNNSSVTLANQKISGMIEVSKNFRAEIEKINNL